MATQRPDIPGYYFDPVTGRYYKIEKSGTAPANAAWSADNVKKRRLQDKKSAAAVHRRNLTKKRVTRSEALKNPLIAGFLDRHIGHARPDLPAAAFASGMLEKGQMPLLDTRWSSRSATVKHMYIGGQDLKTGLCTAWVSMDEMNLLSTYIPRDRNSRIHRQLLANYPTPQNRIAPYAEMMIPQLSDIKYHGGKNLMFITSRVPGRHVTLWVFSPAVSAPEDRLPHWILGSQGTQGFIQLQLRGGGALAQANCVTPAPGNDVAAALVGTSQGLAQFVGSDGRDLRWVTPRKHQPRGSLFRDIFAVSYQHGSSSNMLFGGRPGKLITGDCRVEQGKWDCLELPSPIAHIRSLNEHQALVAGLNNHMAVYDLRFIRRAPDEGTAYRANNRAPVTVFDNYRNAAHCDLGFDYDRETGIVAAGNDNRTMRLYSVRSGRRLPSPCVDSIVSRHGVIHSIQFQKFPGDIMPTLFVGVGSNINAYALGIENIGDEV
ncbi:hypothetical protein F5Y15DRAFT_368721 [Xylariaceae sp. FL0016]|nr:hypothetical protein F5Y15DRAFT_368721 [Xylariaceae sp. FL0016]